MRGLGYRITSQDHGRARDRQPDRAGLPGTARLSGSTARRPRRSPRRSLKMNQNVTHARTARPVVRYGRGALARPVLSQRVARRRPAAKRNRRPARAERVGKTTLLRYRRSAARRVAAACCSTVSQSRDARRDLARRVAVVPQETRADVRLHRPRDGADGSIPAPWTVRTRRASDLEIARAALRGHRHGRARGAAFATLSGGEKQRVVIAGALAQASDMLLLDEPTTALDLRYRFEILAVLRKLNAERGTTLVVSTHDLNLAAALCERVVLLRNGRGARARADQRYADRRQHPCALRRGRRRPLPSARRASHGRTACHSH